MAILGTDKMVAPLNQGNRTLKNEGKKDSEAPPLTEGFFPLLVWDVQTRVALPALSVLKRGVALLRRLHFRSVCIRILEPGVSERVFFGGGQKNSLILI